MVRMGQSWDRSVLRGVTIGVASLEIDDSVDVTIVDHTTTPFNSGDHSAIFEKRVVRVNGDGFGKVITCRILIPNPNPQP